jgi:hypothetical protein
MPVFSRTSALWEYLPAEIKDLIVDGEIILEFVNKYHKTEVITDYSFLVFTFSKAYEGFLKRFLFDTGLIKREDYYGDDIRIGRILNPSFTKEKSNIFNKICDRSVGKEVPKRLWEVWKKGRNLVFHYFPHNFRKLTYEEAIEIIRDIDSAMNLAVMHCSVKFYN